MKKSSLQSIVVLLIAALFFAAFAPGASASPNVQRTLPAGGGAGGASNAAATAAAAATKAVATLKAASGTSTSIAATLKAASGASTSIAATAGAAATKAAATARAAATKAGTASAIKASVTPPAAIGSGDAATAITSYASSVLGIGVTVIKAGGLTGDITRSLSQTSQSTSAQNAVAALAVKTYGAILSNGAASLSYGSGTISGDVNVDVQGASLGVYSLVVSSTGTLNAGSALALAKATFPGVSGLSYTPYTVSKGFAWYAKGTASGLDPKTRKVVTLVETAIYYVLPGSAGKATVTATVGRGDFATAIKAP